MVEEAYTTTTSTKYQPRLFLYKISDWDLEWKAWVVATDLNTAFALVRAHFIDLKRDDVKLKAIEIIADTSDDDDETDTMLFIQP